MAIAAVLHVTFVIVWVDELDVPTKCWLIHVLAECCCLQDSSNILLTAAYVHFALLALTVYDFAA